MPKVYRVDMGEYPDILSLPAKFRRKILRAGVKILAVKVRELVPQSARRGKGKLAKSIRYDVLPGAEAARVYSTSPVAHLVHDGVKAHTILPTKAGGVMRWREGGDWIVARTVHHPGQRPQPFLLQAKEQVGVHLDSEMRRTMDQLLEDV